VERRELQGLYKERAKRHSLGAAGKLSSTREFLAEHQVPLDIKTQVHSSTLPLPSESRTSLDMICSRRCEDGSGHGGTLTT
jgi:hypothetical protein